MIDGSRTVIDTAFTQEHLYGTTHAREMHCSDLSSVSRYGKSANRRARARFANDFPSSLVTRLDRSYWLYRAAVVSTHTCYTLHHAIAVSFGYLTLRYFRPLYSLSSALLENVQEEDSCTP